MPDVITANKFFAAFRIPFFFIMAGYLLNIHQWGGVENYKKFAMKLIKRLLLPYFIAEILFYPIWFVVCHEMGRLNYSLHKLAELNPLETFTAIFIGNGNDSNLILGVLWFLPALLCAEIIFIQLYNRLNEFGAEIFTLSVVVAAYLGFNIKNLFALPLGLDIALVAQIFLLVGVLIRKYNLIERTGLMTCAALTFILVFVSYFNERIDMNCRIYGNVLMFYAGGISGTLLVMKFSALMTAGKIFSLISDCGRQSMMILVLHPIILNVAYEIIVDALNFPAEKIFTDTAVVFFVTAAGVFIPLFVAKKFGRLPVLKYFCA